MAITPVPSFVIFLYIGRKTGDIQEWKTLLHTQNFFSEPIKDHFHTVENPDNIPFHVGQ